MNDYLLSGSLLQRDSGAKKGDVREPGKGKTIQEVIDDASKEIEAVFSKIKKKPVVQANAA